MRIMVLNDSFPPFNNGGSSIIAFNLAAAMKRAGHEIFAFSTCQKKEDAGERQVDGIKVFFKYNNYNPNWRGWVSLKNRKILPELEQQLINFHPDIVHAHNVHGYISYASLKLARKCSKKVFLTAHDVASFHQDKFFSYIKRDDLSIPTEFNYKLTIGEKIRQIKKTRNPFRNSIIRRYLKNVDKIFTVSRALDQALRQNGIANSEVIYNGIEPAEALVGARSLVKEKFNVDPAKKIILIAGRFGGLKGGDLIIKYIKEIKKLFHDFIFVIASDKYRYNENILRQAQASNLSEHLIFTGWLQNDDLMLLYSSCDICLVPSVCFDSFPNNNLEAMSFKKPVIGTCFGGTPEIVVDGETGYIVNPFNIPNVAQKIFDLLANPEKAAKMGAAGLERVKEKFSLKEQADKYLAAFHQSNI